MAESDHKRSALVLTPFELYMAIGFKFLHNATPAALLQGRMKLGSLFAMPEEEFEGLLASVEGTERINLLKKTGVLSVTEFSKARFNTRIFSGYGLRTNAGGLPELVDGKCDYVRIIQGIGREKFEALFLKGDTLSDTDRAKKCGMSAEKARIIREFLNRVFIQAELDNPAAELPHSAIYSTVAGIEIKNGKPALSFFNREVWKGGYSVNAKKLEAYLSGVSRKEASAVLELLNRAKFLERRKTTLYATLEILIEAQADYLLTGEPARRRAYTQLALAKKLDVHTSVLNRLVSNKAVQLPWGMEAPMAELLPSEKKINRDKLYPILIEKPEATDLELTRLLARACGKKISRRSVNQYRRELERK